MKSKCFLAGALLLAAAGLRAETNALPGASGNSFMRHREQGPRWDRNTLRMQVDETQALLDSLARESRGLEDAKTEPLFKSLRDEFHLGGYVGKCRKALKQAEEILEIQESLRFQEKRAQDAGLESGPAEESKLLGLQSDLVGAVDALRDTLRDVHREASEDVNRDLRTWVMVSEGLLRNRREEAAAAAKESPSAATAESPTASPEPAEGAEGPLTYEGAGPQGLSPVAAAPLFPVAALSTTSTPLALPEPTPVKKKAQP